MEDKYRLDLNYKELQLLQNIFNQSNLEIEATTLQEKIFKPKMIKHSSKKTAATTKATETRTKKAKEKIFNAINLLRIENKNITAYAIAKKSECSYNTVKKYYKGGK